MDLGAFNRHTMHPVSHYISCVYNIYPHIPILIVSPYEEKKTYNEIRFWDTKKRNDILILRYICMWAKYVVLLQCNVKRLKHSILDDECPKFGYG